jgi:hypothetical protein
VEVQSVAEKEGSVLMLMMENEIWKIKAPSEHEKQAWMTDLRTATQGVKKKKRGTAIIAHSNLVVPHGGASTQPPQPTNHSKEKKEKEKERN